MPWYGAEADLTLWYGGAVITRSVVKTGSSTLAPGATQTSHVIADADVVAGDDIVVHKDNLQAAMDITAIAVIDGQITLTFASRTNATGESISYSVLRTVAP
jgi:hypothetical protein